MSKGKRAAQKLRLDTNTFKEINNDLFKNTLGSRKQVDEIALVGRVVLALDNVETMLKDLLGKPAIQEHASDKLLGELRRLNQATHPGRCVHVVPRDRPGRTRLLQAVHHEVALHCKQDRGDDYGEVQDPKRMVEDISALGLRHVRHGSPQTSLGLSSRVTPPSSGSSRRSMTPWTPSSGL